MLSVLPSCSSCYFSKAEGTAVLMSETVRKLQGWLCFWRFALSFYFAELKENIINSGFCAKILVFSAVLGVHVQVLAEGGCRGCLCKKRTQMVPDGSTAGPLQDTAESISKVDGAFLETFKKEQERLERERRRRRELEGKNRRTPRSGEQEVLHGGAGTPQ